MVVRGCIKRKPYVPYTYVLKPYSDKVGNFCGERPGRCGAKYRIERQFTLLYASRLGRKKNSGVLEKDYGVINHGAIDPSLIYGRFRKIMQAPNCQSAQYTQAFVVRCKPISFGRLVTDP
jgi:hypothetical protein